MNFEQVKIKLEKFKATDIMAESHEEPTTETPVETTTNYDPYHDDVW